jgi:hypothetical protein
VAGNATESVKLQVKGSANVRKGQPVKPSAQPTLVRTQHLPPCDLSRHRGHREPALGARWFRILGAGWPAGGLVIAVGVEGELAEELAGGCVDDLDVQVLHEQQDGLPACWKSHRNSRRGATRRAADPGRRCRTGPGREPGQGGQLRTRWRHGLRRKPRTPPQPGIRRHPSPRPDPPRAAPCSAAHRSGRTAPCPAYQSGSPGTHAPARSRTGGSSAAAAAGPVEIPAQAQHKVTLAFTGDLIGDLGLSRLGVQGWRHGEPHRHDPSPQEVPARTHADPVAKKRLPRQIDRPRCRPGGRLMRQIIPFGRETGSHVSYQVADHIGGSGAAVTTHAVTFRDRSGCLRAVPDVR